jgi:hypothetical protein
VLWSDAEVITDEARFRSCGCSDWEGVVNRDGPPAEDLRPLTHKPHVPPVGAQSRASALAIVSKPSGLADIRTRFEVAKCSLE